VAYLTIQKEKVKIKTKKNQFKAIGEALKMIFHPKILKPRRLP